MFKLFGLVFGRCVKANRTGRNDGQISSEAKEHM